MDVVFYADEVYYILKHGCSENSVIKGINSVDLEWHMLVVLTHGIDQLATPLVNEDFEVICRNAKYIMTTAYDGEGYLFWERNAVL